MDNLPDSYQARDPSLNGHGESNLARPYVRLTLCHHHHLDWEISIVTISSLGMRLIKRTFIATINLLGPILDGRQLQDAELHLLCRDKDARNVLGGNTDQSYLVLLWLLSLSAACFSLPDTLICMLF